MRRSAANLEMLIALAMPAYNGASPAGPSRSMGALGCECDSAEVSVPTTRDNQNMLLEEMRLQDVSVEKCSRLLEQPLKVVSAKRAYKALLGKVKRVAETDLCENFEAVFSLLDIDPAEIFSAGKWHKCEDPKEICARLYGAYKAVYAVTPDDLQEHFSRNLTDYGDCVAKAEEEIEFWRSKKVGHLPQDAVQHIDKYIEIMTGDRLATLRSGWPAMHRSALEVVSGNTPEMGRSPTKLSYGDQLRYISKTMASISRTYLFSVYKQMWAEESMRCTDTLEMLVRQSILLAAVQDLVKRAESVLVHSVDCSFTLIALTGLLERISEPSFCRHGQGHPYTAGGIGTATQEDYDPKAGPRHIRKICLLEIVNWILASSQQACMHLGSYYHHWGNDALVRSIHERFYGNEGWEDITVNGAMRRIKKVISSTSDGGEKGKLTYLGRVGYHFIYHADALHEPACAAARALKICKRF